MGRFQGGCGGRWQSVSCAHTDQYQEKITSTITLACKVKNVSMSAVGDHVDELAID